MAPRSDAASRGDDGFSLTVPNALWASLADAEAMSSPSEDAEQLAGLPQDRAARIAARRAFVAMKQLFMRAVETLTDRKGQWLRHQVRLADDPIDLWLLRGPVLSALRRDDRVSRNLRAELYRGLDTTFPDAFGLNEGISLPALPEPWEMGLATPTGLLARAGGR